MVSDRDVWASAKLILEQHGDNAESVASTREQALMDEGARTGAEAWRRIREAIVWMRTADNKKGGSA